MKKIFTPLLLLCATALSSSAAETSLTVCDGTGFNTVPVYGQWMDRPNHSQVIYPAEMLKDLKGNNLLSLTFYPKSVSKEWTNEDIVVSLAEVEQTVFDGENKAYIDAALTQVSSAPVALAADATSWTVTFSTPYAYKGGNLLIDISNAKGGSSPTINWFGEWQPAGSYTAVVKGIDLRVVNFLPKLMLGATSEALGARASVGVKELVFPLTFTDDSSELSVKVFSIGSEAVSGTVSVTGSDAFSTEMTEISALEPGREIEVPVTFAPKATDNNTEGVLHIDLGEAGIFEVALKGAALEVPTAYRQLFDSGNFEETIPAGWTPWAVEVLAADESEISDQTTDYSAFPSVYRFSNFKFGNGEGIAWNHVNWAPSSELYRQFYYLVSPVLSGKVMIRAMFTDLPATGAFIEVYPATKAESGSFELAAEPLTIDWDEALGNTAWSVGTMNLPYETQLAFFMKYAALDLVASDVTTGVECVAVEAASSKELEVYTLSGCRVNGGAWKSGAVPAGVYILREGGKTSKILKK